MPLNIKAFERAIKKQQKKRKKLLCLLPLL